MSYEKKCPGCEVLLVITEDPGIGPGGKDRETAYCPICRTEVASEMTEGFLYAELKEPPHQVMR